MTRPKPPSAAGAVGLLTDLLADSLDPGYAEAAARKAAARDAGGTDPSARRLSADTLRVITAVVCLLTGFIFAVAYQSTRKSAPANSLVQKSLLAKVRAGQTEDARLAGEANRLNGQVQAAQQQATGAGPSGEQLTRAEELAGTIAVHGPGLAVTMNNPPLGGGANGRLLIDLDLRSVVNALWLAGAEAITINDIRLTPTTAVRFAGRSILVDFQPLAAPYTIRAIGDPDSMVTRFTVSDVASRYRTLASAYGFQFTLTSSASLQLPAAASRNNRYAKPSKFDSVEVPSR
ncbi:MAG: DUF881 domain-containing protein [Jatrophihabitans sp.]